MISTFCCSNCHQDLPSTCFYLKYKEVAEKRSDWTSWCTECIKQYKKTYYQKHGQRINAEHRRHRDENHEQCLELEAARRLARSKNPDVILRRRTVVALDQRDRYLHDRTKNWMASARRRGFDWDLSLDYVKELILQQNETCFYTGRPLVFAPNHPDTLSLDRIDSARGYIPGNVVACGTRVNRMKLEMTIEEFVREMAAISAYLANKS